LLYCYPLANNIALPSLHMTKHYRLH